MRSSKLAEAYLTFPTRDVIPLGGMQWSHDGDAIEDADGRTVCLIEQLQEVLHGAFAAASIPHFGHLMYLLRAIRFGGSTPAFERIKRAYAECSTAAAIGRNTGALIAHLCSGFALMLDPPTIDELIETLSARRRHGLRQRTDLKLYVAVPLAEAGPKFAERIGALGDEQLRHWFRFGRPGLAPDDRIAEEVERLPFRVLKLIASARSSPRMVGAASLIPALDAALTIPPRKRSPDAVPQGGYADVTTRGNPDQLLPSQFALEPDEFVRRFAEHELLFFQREEPHETQKPERVLVFDQGVRTWGRVRLALAGAVLSLLKHDARKVGDVRLHVTSQLEPVALRHAPLESLSEILEASDFTTGPGETFQRALAESDGDAPRDLIVLTHPRNVAALMVEPEDRRPGDRIFAFAVQEDGAARLGELRNEGMVWLRSFRLDLQSAAEEQVESERPEPRKPFVSWTPWTGDVEPIGFPFRPGIIADVDVMGFSAEGDWLVAASQAGVLHAIACDGSGTEVLPRGMLNGKAITGIGYILSVSGGVVLVGKPYVSMMSSATFEDGSGMSSSMDLVHYDFRSRRAQVLHVSTIGPFTECVSCVDSDCVVVMQAQPNRIPKYLVHLMAGSVSKFDTKTSDSRHVAAALRSNRNESPIQLPIHRASESLPFADGPFLFIDRHHVTVRGTESPWETFLPLNNGKPLLEGKNVVGAQLAGETLALKMTTATATKVVLFRGPEGRTLMEVNTYPQAAFILSPDGELFGYARGKRKVAVQATAEVRAALATVSRAKLHDQISTYIAAEPFHLILVVGSNAHEFRIEAGRLTHSFKPWKRSDRTLTYTSCAATAYDAQRFGAWDKPHGGVFHAVPDKFGLVHLIANGETLVASFCIRRELAAAWIPDGVFWGSPALIGGPPHPNAAQLIGEAIRNAGGAE